VLHVTAVETSNYYLNNLARCTPKGEVRLLAVTLGRRGSFVTDLEALDVRTWALGAVRRWSYPRAVVRLWRLVRRESVDVLHLHLFEPTVLGLLVAGLSGRPAVVTRHHSDAVQRLPGGLKKSVYSALERWIGRKARHLIAPSQRVRDVLVDVEGVPARKVSLIPYGQMAGRFEAIRREDSARARREFGDASPLLVCVCRLHPEKGHRYLFEAFSGLHTELTRVTVDLSGKSSARVDVPLKSFVNVAGHKGLMTELLDHNLRDFSDKNFIFND
jgi:glycosyltransferase involved in cell wall biosynthesis